MFCLEDVCKTQNMKLFKYTYRKKSVCGGWGGISADCGQLICSF